MAAATWIVVAILCADRGLDLSDESFYLVSYRWWNDNLDAFTGVQYVYGPVFEVLGYDIARLRLVRLAVTVLAHVWLGWTFMRWLRTRRPDAPATRWWELAGAATIAASGGITYSWLPLSPGYNDLALACALVLAGGVLWIARDAASDRAPAAWVPVAMGVTAVVMALAKWSSAALVLLGLVVVLVVVHACARQGWLRFARLVGLALVGVCLMVAFVHLALVPVQKLLPPMLEVNSLVAESTNSPSVLLIRYRDGAEILLGDIIEGYWPLLVAAVVVPVLAQWSSRVAVGLVALAVGWGVVQAVRLDGTIAGPDHLTPFTVTIFAPLVAVALASATTATVHVVLRGRGRHRPVASVRRRLPGVTIGVMLLVLPVAVSLGTGNLLQYMAVLGLASWIALAILVLTAGWCRVPGARVLVAAAIAGMVLASTVIAVDGLWNRPYRTSGHDASTTHARDVPALDSLLLASEDAEDYAELRERLLPYVEEPGRAMMPFDGMAGLVYLLDGRPVGEAWYSAKDTIRSTTGVVRTCAADRWWGGRRPIVLFSRPVTALERSALRHCGIHLARYEQITGVGPIPGVVIYVPPLPGGQSGR